VPGGVTLARSVTVRLPCLTTNDPATDPLAGWKESGDLPADTVVTDYNEYIEALPAAERPGVANVKYYTDDSGRTGVLVIVFVNREPWNHLLVYDKDQRRSGVTKQPAAPASK
jgi:hypothetical protein